MMKGYPIFLNDLDQRKAVVIGGGEEAERKVRGLLACDANVTVVSETVSPEMRHLIMRSDKVTWIPREYDTGDMDGAFLVIAEHNTPERNAKIYRDAELEGVLVNVMDDIDHCNFVAGSVVRRGPLTVAISTSGAAPTYAVRFRQRLERELSEQLGDYLTHMNDLRAPIADTHYCFQERRGRWYTLADSDALALLEAGNKAAFRTKLVEIWGDEVVAKWEGSEPLTDLQETHTICEFFCKAPLNQVACPHEA